jgi:adenylate cyclase
MSFEIERKFLVRSAEWTEYVTMQTRMRQAYLASDGKASIRVRIKDDGGATLTIKSRGVGLRRLELEYPIPPLEAEALIPLRSGSIVEKVRHIVPYRAHTWEIDVFAGENTGLVVAEVELGDEQQRVELPPWVGTEITGQAQYYNGSLAQRPYGSWPILLPTQAAC